MYNVFPIFLFLLCSRRRHRSIGARGWPGMWPYRRWWSRFDVLCVFYIVWV